MVYLACPSRILYMHVPYLILYIYLSTYSIAVQRTYYPQAPGPLLTSDVYICVHTYAT